MEEEKKYLDFVIKYVNEKLNQELESFDELQYKYKRYPEQYGIAYRLAVNTLKVLNNGIKKPYFARIDFRELNSTKIEKCYIGKYGIIDEKANTLVLDWRAPISNLYYDSDIGKVSYESPSGVINGELLLKRQYEIENGILNNFYDVDLVSNDVLLQKYLNNNNDIRLKNIVSTIQKEQNDAIRKPLDKNIIVQGVAGSGKTTIALHRIAYLVYNYKNRIKNNQYLVIGPNDVFLKYIKSVLPDLDVDDINQKTYESFAKFVIEDEDLNVNSSSKYLNKYLIKKPNNDIPKFKSSLKFKNMIDLFFDDYINSIFEQDLELKGYKILNKNELKAILQTAIEDTKNFEKTIDRFVLLGSNYIEKNKEKIVDKINDESYKRFKSTNNKEKERKDKSFVKSELDKNCKSLLRKYISRIKTTPLKLYKKFISSIDLYNIYNYEYLDELKKVTLDNLKNNCCDFEDLAPLMHLKYRLGVTDIERNYRHVVVDEAQDLGEFNFVVLKECLPNSTFSIYGDISQSIYDYRSINSWDEVKKIFDDCQILSFRKSYRTTDEIMEVANSVSEFLNIESAELSIRHGENVTFEQIDKGNIVRCIKEKIDKYKQDGYKTIAVISKYPMQSNYLNDDLSFEGLYIPNIDEKTDITNENNNVLTISNYLSKGLEFDCVILNDVSEQIYNSNNPSDMKMLYVALTRALHKLDIIYTDEITKPLKKFIQEKNKIK